MKNDAKCEIHQKVSGGGGGDHKIYQAVAKKSEKFDERSQEKSF